MKNRISQRAILNLKDDEIFVFGSNESGLHIGGAAKIASLRFGALEGQGEGLQGYSYAIPTIRTNLDGTLTIPEILPYVISFIMFAKSKPEKKFLVTEIGCGIAGYTPEEIAPLFSDALKVKNIHLPESFWNVLLKSKSVS